MPGLSDSSENSFLNLLFSATAWANVADNAASTPLTNISVALHTADPIPVGTETGTMQTSEIAYTSYARVNVARSTGWTTATTGVVNPAAQIDFPAGTGGTGTASFFSTGKTTGAPASIIFFAGAVTPSIVCGNAITPHLTTASSISID
jgi:hypothetical protein